MEEQKQQPEEQKSQPTENKAEEKDTFGKRMKRGFGVMYDKLRGLRDNMAEANKSQETKKDEPMFDMTYAPDELK